MMGIKANVQAKARIQAAFDTLIKSPQALFEGWANRELLDLYGSAQLQRWTTAGTSEGDLWQPLNPWYVQVKLKRYKESPGGGRKMLIATGALLASVLPPNKRPFGPPSGDQFRKVISNGRVTLGTLVPYAASVNEVRDIKKFSPETRRAWQKAWKDYLLKGIKKR